MKKKLKLFIPLGVVVVLIVVMLCALLPKYLGRGEVLLTAYGISASGERLVRAQVRETGTRQTTLLRSEDAEHTFSSNGRYLALSFRDEDSRSTLKFFDLQKSKRPLVTRYGYTSFLLVTNGGHFVYWDEGLFCHDGKQESLLDAQAHLSNAQILDETVYYFRKNEKTFDLYACDLPNGTPRLLLDDVSPQSLQTSVYEGRHYVIILRRHTMTGTVYDQIIDDCGPEQDDLRAKLKAREVTENVYDIYRIVDGTLTLLAEHVLTDSTTQAEPYRVEPVTGTVVHKASAFVHPVWKLSQVQYASITLDERKGWYLSVCGQTQFLATSSSLAPILTPNGNVYLNESNAIARYTGLGEAERIEVSAAWFTVALEPDGSEALYVCTQDRRLLKNGEEVASSVFELYLSAERLPGGALRLLDDTILLTRLAEDGFLSTLSGRTAPYAGSMSRLDSYILYRLKDGVETPLLQGFTMSPKALMENGDVLIRVSGGWRAVGEDRSELVSLPRGLFFPAEAKTFHAASNWLGQALQ